MSVSLKSEGELPKDGDNAVVDGENEFRNSRLSLSKEKASPDGAHEKLLQKEDEAKIVRVDMVDARFVSGDHRNGDAKIELDANKKQFSGLTKEELMKYADDPFWVNLRWFMFVLFWALWLGMLAGAITIIVRAPKCAAPTPKTWYAKGPLVEVDAADYSEVEGQLPLLQSSKVEGIFMKAETYDALDKPDVVDRFKQFVEEAKKYGIKVIVDLTPNFVSSGHPWFLASENKTAPFADYFLWSKGKFDRSGQPLPPNEWVSTLNAPAWTWSDVRKEFYLHQFAADQPDLDFNRPAVRELFAGALRQWMAAGAAGVRLNKARLMLVDPSLGPESAATGAGSTPGADHTQHSYYRHTRTADQPGLDAMLTAFADVVAAAATLEPKETVFTLKEDEPMPALYLLAREGAVAQRPPSAAPVTVARAAEAATQLLVFISTGGKFSSRWPLLQLKADGADGEAQKELARWALLLPAVPLLDLAQLDNDTSTDSLSHLTALRADASVQHGGYLIGAVDGRGDGNSTQQLLACARWKVGHNGYVGVFNPTAAGLRADLSALRSVPAALSVHHVSARVRLATNYTNNYLVHSDNVLVPGKSTVVLSYVPETTGDN